jgi:predicted nucleic acid-binding protein
MSQPLDHVITAYFDSSALVKRYLAEAGTVWVQAWCDSPTQTVAVAEIALVEIAAAFAAKLRGEFISQEAYYDARADLAADSRDEYVLVAVSRAVVDEAVELTARHRLSPLVFVSADSDLLAAAAAEKLPTDNPNNYP